MTTRTLNDWCGLVTVGMFICGIAFVGAALCGAGDIPLVFRVFGGLMWLGAVVCAVTIAGLERGWKWLVAPGPEEE